MRFRLFDIDSDDLSPEKISPDGQFYKVFPKIENRINVVGHPHYTENIELPYLCSRFSTPSDSNNKFSVSMDSKSSEEAK